MWNQCEIIHFSWESFSKITCKTYCTIARIYHIFHLFYFQKIVISHDSFSFPQLRHHALQPFPSFTSRPSIIFLLSSPRFLLSSQWKIIYSAVNVSLFLKPIVTSRNSWRDRLDLHLFQRCEFHRATILTTRDTSSFVGLSCVCIRVSEGTPHVVSNTWYAPIAYISAQ